MTDLYPVTVFTSRYNGAYEGAPWIAVQAHADPAMRTYGGGTGTNLSGCQSGDVECMEWFDLRMSSGHPIGRGDTPDRAVADLVRQLGISWTPGEDGIQAQFQKALEEAQAARDGGEHEVNSADQARAWAEKAELSWQAAEGHLTSPWDRWEIHQTMSMMWAQVALAEAARPAAVDTPEKEICGANAPNSVGADCWCTRAPHTDVFHLCDPCNTAWVEKAEKESAE